MHGHLLCHFFDVFSLMQCSSFYVQSIQAAGQGATVRMPAWKQRLGFVASELQALKAKAFPATFLTGTNIYTATSLVRGITLQR